MKLYLDSSALAKRYIAELGSARVDDLLQSATELGLSLLTPTEMISALSRRLRESGITEAQYQGIKRTFLEELEDAVTIPLNNQVIARAIAIIEQSALKSSDALQVASAAEWGCELFASADAQQCRAALKYGLNVERIKQT